MALHVVRRAERGAKVAPGVVEAVDVGAHQANAMLAADLDDLLLARDIAGLGKSRGNEDGPWNLFLAALDERLSHELCRDREHRNVDHPRDVLDALVRRASHDFGGRGIDRVNLALVAAVDQILHYGVADLALFR